MFSTSTSSSPSQEIAFISAEKQRQTPAFFSEYKDIPFVNRNLHSGWPLLQVSLFSLLSEPAKAGKYKVMLEGGHCHTLNIGSFFFAQLLTQIPPYNKINVIIDGQKRPLIEFNVYNLSSILKGYEVNHAKFNLGIQEFDTGGGPYGGKVNLINVPKNWSEEKSNLHQALSGVFEYAKTSDDRLQEGQPYFKSWHFEDWGSKKSLSFDKTDIESSINSERAIFHNGQIFIDLGQLLKLAMFKVNDDLINYLEKVFKVKKFLEVSKKAKLDPLTCLEKDDNSPQDAKYVSEVDSISIIQKSVSQIALNTKSSLFTETEEKNIVNFFGSDLLTAIKKLNQILENEASSDQEKIEAKENNDDSVLSKEKFKILIIALKKTPVSNLSKEEAGKNIDVIGIAGAATALEAQLKLKNRWKVVKKYIYRILGAIALAAPGACGGFKAGTALGGLAGGGIFSVPAGVIGGISGAVVGGGLGLWTGYKGGNWVGNFFSSARAKADYSTVIKDTIDRRIITPKNKGKN